MIYIYDDGCLLSIVHYQPFSTISQPLLIVISHLSPFSIMIRNDRCQPVIGPLWIFNKKHLKSEAISRGRTSLTFHSCYDLGRARDTAMASHPQPLGFTELKTCTHGWKQQELHQGPSVVGSGKPIAKMIAARYYVLSTWQKLNKNHEVCGCAGVGVYGGNQQRLEAVKIAVSPRDQNPRVWGPQVIPRWFSQ